MNSEMSGSGNLCIFPSNFYRYRSALSHLVTSKLALAFYSRFNCLTFDTISSRSLILLCSLFIEAMLRERFLLRGSSSPYESVTDRLDLAEAWRLGLLSDRN